MHDRCSTANASSELTANEERVTEKDIRRYWEKVSRAAPEECWEWEAYRDKDGYGRFRLNGKKWQAHRVAVLLDGRNPEGKVVMHTCDNPGCVNPSHLVVGTQQENIRDALRKGRLDNRGVRNGRSKLDPEKVRRIRASDRPSRALARRYEVDPKTIRDIRANKLWKHVEEGDVGSTS